MEDQEKNQPVSGIGVWAESGADKIPGSTRVPIEEFIKVFGSLEGKKILDVGSGAGRSTITFKKEGAEVIALDLSYPGLKRTHDELNVPAVQGQAELLPFKNETFDGINLCGLLTNLTDKDPEKAQELRKGVLKELYRSLKEGGYLIISDFCAEHNLTNYPVNYTRHKLITNEYGTIAVFDPSKKITFKGLTDEEVRELGNSPDLQRYAHHYTPQEIIGLLKEVGFIPLWYTVEIGRTPSGSPIENIIVVGQKLLEQSADFK